MLKCSGVTLNKTAVDEKGNKKAFSLFTDLDFTVNPAEIFVLMGPSGSGKTSLLRLINRLEDPDKGFIYFNNTDIREISILDLRRKIGFVHQIPHMFEGSVLDNLLYGPKLAGMDLQNKEKEVHEYLPLFGFKADIIHRNPALLSVGEKQRISILRAIMNEPQLLLLDEPTSAIDPKNAAQVLNLIKQLNEKKQVAIIIVTHIPEHAKRVANRGMILFEGKKLAEGPVKEILDIRINPEVAKFLSEVKKEEGELIELDIRDNNLKDV